MAAAHGAPYRKTYEEAFSAWVEHVTGQIAPGTAKRYGVSLRQLEPDIKHLHIDEVDDDVVSAIISRRKRDGATMATIRRDLSALSSVLEFAVDEKWRRGNPALDRMKRLKERRDPITLPTARSIEIVATRAPGNMAHMIRFALATGCRQEEIAAAEWDQIDTVRRQFSIPRTKTNRPRVISLSAEAVEILKAIPRRLKCPFVFWHDDGTRYANLASRFSAIVLSAQKGAQERGEAFRRFRFHDLRHRFAVDYLKRGGSIYDLQIHLGHSSVKTTEIYLDHLTPDERKVAKYGAQKMAHSEAVQNVPQAI
jgi:integrase/recombinase XerD